MSDSDIETLRAEYDALSRRDWDSLFDSAHPEFEFRTPDRGLGPGVVRGPERARRAMQDFFEPYEEILVEPQEFFDADERIVVYFRQRCRPKGSSAVVEIRAGHLWTMRDGRAASLQIFPEREAARVAAGLLE
ncbi:MAG TPA: nuclear transport factor 2 family protein [Solirubrobacterales bacterium]|nr:nuclear transport factor 2 family protein [Solirubrobacterales bacterium]